MAQTQTIIKLDATDLENKIKNIMNRKNENSMIIIVSVSEKNL